MVKTVIQAGLKAAFEAGLKVVLLIFAVSIAASLINFGIVGLLADWVEQLRLATLRGAAAGGFVFVLIAGFFALMAWGHARVASAEEEGGDAP